MENKMQTITLNVGETFVIDLPGHAAAGYEWFFVCDNPALITARKQFVHPEPNSPPGKSAKEEFTLRALAKGEVHIQFILKRAWETAIAERQVLKVSITQTN